MVQILLLISFGWYWSILYAPFIKTLFAHLFIGWKWLKDTYFGCCKSQILFKQQICDKTGAGCQDQKYIKRSVMPSSPNCSSNLHYQKANITTFLIRLAFLLCPNALQFRYNLHNLLWFGSSATKLCWGLSFPVLTAWKWKHVMPSCLEYRIWK